MEHQQGPDHALPTTAQDGTGIQEPPARRRETKVRICRFLATLAGCARGRDHLHRSTSRDPARHGRCSMRASSIASSPTAAPVDGKLPRSSGSSATSGSSTGSPRIYSTRCAASSGHLELRRRPTELRALVEAGPRAGRPDAPPPGAVSLESPSPRHESPIDDLRIERVIANLVEERPQVRAAG